MEANYMVNKVQYINWLEKILTNRNEIRSDNPCNKMEKDNFEKLSEFYSDIDDYAIKNNISKSVEQSGICMCYSYIIRYNNKFYKVELVKCGKYDTYFVTKTSQAKAIDYNLILNGQDLLNTARINNTISNLKTYLIGLNTSDPDALNLIIDAFNNSIPIGILNSKIDLYICRIKGYVDAGVPLKLIIDEINDIIEARGKQYVKDTRSTKK